MNGDPYSAEVRRLFAEPVHAGTAGDLSVLAEANGVRVELSAEASDGSVSSLSFRAWGCPHLIAACEAVCAELEGSDRDALKRYRTSGIMRRLSIPVEKTGRILVLEDAVAMLADRV